MNKLFLIISFLWLYAGCSAQEIAEKTTQEEQHAVRKEIHHHNDSAEYYYRGRLKLKQKAIIQGNGN